tara:strand:- start:10275 stop:12689 length:2415 start_codon:yes stop_codon:yes gene_type:complete
MEHEAYVKNYKDQDILNLAKATDTELLSLNASSLRDSNFSNIITYSPKVFIPLTHLCRDVCHYCTFAKTPKNVKSLFMSIEEVVESAKKAEKAGCKEALFTLGEKPELRYSAARKALKDLGHDSTLSYLHEASSAVLKETSLLPHLNPGCMTSEEIISMREVSASMGLMLESSSLRLCEKGGPHYGSPDKDPRVRLQTIELAGIHKIPFTTGILIGIGETRLERIESLIDIKNIHDKYGHIQEVIIQNFKPKQNTKMSASEEPLTEDLIWTIAIARIIFGKGMSIQAPPNLSPNKLNLLINAGINDWGGVSPLTPDYVNPELPWPHLEELAKETLASNKILVPRLTIYPKYLDDLNHWSHKTLHAKILFLSDATGLSREDNWITGKGKIPIKKDSVIPLHKSITFKEHLKVVELGKSLNNKQIIELFNARGSDFNYVIEAANELRKDQIGNEVTYVVNRNINYTNICYFGCTFCAFSKGQGNSDLRGSPYDIPISEILRRCQEAEDRGATEVCLQGGIHPSYDGHTYMEIVNSIKKHNPSLHIHAFSPLEVWQGASSLDLSLKDYLTELKRIGLGTLPGTAAEILDDSIRQIICPDKINTSQWIEVMKTAHEIGLASTSTIMFGHIEKPEHWANHLMQIRRLQEETGGFTEFVPLPYVAQEAPMYKKGKSRFGPTLRESVLMHAVSRLVFHGLIKNIQTSWVKMGPSGVKLCLEAGANDLGGTLMNESITSAAGSEHGQELSPFKLENIIQDMGRTPRQRNTLYGQVESQISSKAKTPSKLQEPINGLVDRKKIKKDLIRIKNI